MTVAESLVYFFFTTTFWVAIPGLVVLIIVALFYGR